MVDNLTCRHAGTVGRVFAFVNHVLQEVRARAQVDSLAALHDSVDSCDHLGGPIDFDVDAEGTKEAFEVDILSIVRE